MSSRPLYKVNYLKVAKILQLKAGCHEMVEFQEFQQLQYDRYRTSCPEFYDPTDENFTFFFDQKQENMRSQQGQVGNFFVKDNCIEMQDAMLPF